MSFRSWHYINCHKPCCYLGPSLFQAEGVSRANAQRQKWASPTGTGKRMGSLSSSVLRKVGDEVGFGAEKWQDGTCILTQTFK